MKNVSAALITLVLSLAPLAVWAAPERARGAGFDRERYAIPHHQIVLDNGLTLLVHEDHSVPIVAVNMWYHVGSRNEERGKTGFAHLFEHFFFNGSENYPHGFREAMDDLGANNRNGTTSTDRTNFFEDVPVSALERTLYLEADRMGFLAGHISQEMLERERGVVQNEKRLGENQPYGRVFGAVVETIYPYHHPYSWSTIGSMEDLDAASLEDVKEWYRTYYGPNNAVISLAGDITAARARELVEKYFGGIPPGPPLSRAEAWIPTLDRNVREMMEDRVPQARLYRFYHVPGWSDPELQYLDLFGSVLSGSRSARLDRRLLYEKELVTTISAGTWTKELASNFIVSATVKAGVDPAEVEKEIDAIVGELIAKGPTAEELRRAQSRDLAAFTRGMERLGGFGGRSDLLAESMTYGGDPNAYLDQLERKATATPEQVRRAGAKWLDAHHYTMLVTPFARLEAKKVELDRSILPPLGEAPEVRFPELQRAELKNGLGVILLERHSVPIVNFALAVDAGYAADAPRTAGLASLALNLMDDGTSTRDTFRIVDELDALGARIFTGSSLDLSLVRLQAMPANLAPSLEIFADVVLNPSFPSDLVELEKRRRLAQIEQERAQPTGSAIRVLPVILFGNDHAYGKPLTGSGFERTIAPLTRESLAEWHRTWFKPTNATLIVTGGVTMDALLPALERVFSAWKGGEVPQKKLDTVPSTAGGKVYLIDKPGAPQSVIVAAHLSEPGGQADELAIEAAMQNFGGMATSRLNRNLRLDKHWSYGAQGFLLDARGQRPMIVIAPVQTDKTTEAMAEVAKELREVAGERPVAGEEFASLMRNMTMRLPGRFETLSSIEGAALEMLNYNYPDDYYQRYAGEVRGLTESDLAGASSRYVRPREAIWLIIGDLEKIEAGIRQLDFGEVVRFEGER